MGRNCYLVLFIPTCLLGGCNDREDDPREAYGPHMATAWRVTPGGARRDAGPFGSVKAGFTTDEDIDAAIDAARADFALKFPQYAWVNPMVHLTDDYVFFVDLAQAWASGMNIGHNNIAVALWSKVQTTEEPPDGSCWIKRPPGDRFVIYNWGWRSTVFPLAPAYQHECLHVAIGDPTHSSPYWSKL